MDIIWGGFSVSTASTRAISTTSLRPVVVSVCAASRAETMAVGTDEERLPSDEIARGIDLATAAGIKLVLTFIVGYPRRNARLDRFDACLYQCHGQQHKSYSSFQVYPFYLLPNNRGGRSGIPEALSSHRTSWRGRMTP